MVTKVLQFDIDLTLLWSGHAGTRAVDRAFREVYRIEDGKQVQLRLLNPNEVGMLRSECIMSEIACSG